MDTVPTEKASAEMISHKVELVDTKIFYSYSFMNDNLKFSVLWEFYQILHCKVHYVFNIF